MGTDQEKKNRGRSSDAKNRSMLTVAPVLGHAYMARSKARRNCPEKAYSQKEECGKIEGRVEHKGKEE